MRKKLSVLCILLSAVLAGCGNSSDVTTSIDETSAQSGMTSSVQTEIKTELETTDSSELPVTRTTTVKNSETTKITTSQETEYVFVKSNSDRLVTDPETDNSGMHFELEVKDDKKELKNADPNYLELVFKDHSPDDYSLSAYDENNSFCFTVGDRDYFVYYKEWITVMYDLNKKEEFLQYKRMRVSRIVYSGDNYYFITASSDYLQTDEFIYDLGNGNIINNDTYSYKFGESMFSDEFGKYMSYEVCFDLNELSGAEDNFSDYEERIKTYEKIVSKTDNFQKYYNNNVYYTDLNNDGRYELAVVLEDKICFYDKDKIACEYSYDSVMYGVSNIEYRNGEFQVELEHDEWTFAFPVYWYGNELTANEPEMKRKYYPDEPIGFGFALENDKGEEFILHINDITDLYYFWLDFLKNVENKEINYFVLYDIDKDGTDEFIVCTGTYEGDSECNVFSYGKENNDYAIFREALSSWHRGLYEENGELYLIGGHMGDTWKDKITLKDNNVTLENIYNRQGYIGIFSEDHYEDAPDSYFIKVPYEHRQLLIDGQKNYLGKMLGVPEDDNISMEITGVIRDGQFMYQTGVTISFTKNGKKVAGGDLYFDSFEFKNAQMYN